MVRSRLIYIFPILLALVLAVAFLPIIGGQSLLQVWRPTGEITPTIVIDPGHGGIDGGAVGIDDSFEKNINLSISKKLKHLFEIHGFCVIMTREDDRSIHDNRYNTINGQKVSDLHNRLAIVSRTNNAILLSIHQNQFPISKYWGTQVFYGPKNTESILLAQCVQDTVVSMLQPENERMIKRAGDNLYILYNVKQPAVLVECGFLSNRDECGLLNDDLYQEKLAFAIFCSFLEYLGK